MHFIIVGASDITITLIDCILDKGDRLTIVDRLEETCTNLKKAYPAIECAFGDGTDRSILTKAGADKADAIVAATRSDASNILICELAKNEYGIPHTIAVLNNPKNRPLFEEKKVVDTFISPTELALAIFETAVRRDYHVPLISLKDMNFKVAEFIVNVQTKLIGMKMSQIDLPKESRIGMVWRESQTSFPDQDEILKLYDRLFIYGTVKGVDAAIQKLRNP